MIGEFKEFFGNIGHKSGDWVAAFLAKIKSAAGKTQKEFFFSPRHAEVADGLATEICKDLGIPAPCWALSANPAEAAPTPPEHRIRRLQEAFAGRGSPAS